VHSGGTPRFGWMFLRMLYLAPARRLNSTVIRPLEIDHEGFSMKRDMDLLRKIFLELESKSFEQMGLELKLEGYDDQIVSFHVILLDEAGLV
jgi:hypothetical protein